MTILKATLIALILQAPLANPPELPKAAVSGVVVNANGEPVPNIRVTLGKLGVNLGQFLQFVAGERPPRETTISSEAFTILTESLALELAGGGLPPEQVKRAEMLRAVPLDDIHEITVTPTGLVSTVYKSNPPALTDERGRFSFDAVDPGRYRLTFSGGSYARMDFGQRTIGSAGVPLILTPGQSKSDIVMRMLAVGAVTGRVLDRLGQPAAGVPVQLVRFVYNETGQRILRPVTATRTNDLGEYRMYYLTPGRYYISAGTSSGTFPDTAFSSGGSSGSNRLSQSYALTYYPGVASENEARPIEVPSGMDLRGIDFLVTPLQTYKVRGRVVDSRTGEAPQTVSFTMSVESPDRSSVSTMGAPNPNYKAADGSFEMQNVAVGTYSLSATLPTPARPLPVDFNSFSPAERNEYFRAMEAEERVRPKASLPLRVVNADLEGVVLSIGVNGSMSGRLRVEANAANTPPNLDFVRVVLKSPTPVSLFDGEPQARFVAADGTFRIDNIRPGEYRVSIAGLPEGFYLKEARAGDIDVLNGTFRYASGEAPALDVVLSAGVGAVEGTTDPGSQVVLIPNRNRERTELFRTVSADSTGRFVIPNVAPGDYRLAAWEALEPWAFFDPSLIQQADDQGRAVRVMESSTETVSVNAIR